ncbi:MAG: hypothetical protein VB858_22315 [Planctomycetaceae bacterium]
MADSSNERRKSTRRAGAARSSDREAGTRRRRTSSREETALRRAGGKQKRISPALIQVAEEENARTLGERLEVKTSVPGVATSFVLHGVILFALTLFAVATDFDAEAPLTGDWLVETRIDEPDRPRETARPVQLQPISPSRPKKKKPAPKTTTGEKIIRPVRPIPVEKSLAGRTERAKAGVLDSVGNRDSIRRAIDSGLAWVVRQQGDSGKWQLHAGGYPDPGTRTLRTDTGATALALLALLGDGHIHRGSSSRYQAAVASGLRWLRGVQKVDGDFHDHVEMGRQSSFYAHSQAVIAICEAIVLSGDETFRDSAEAGVQYLLDSQHPTQGGWKYMPQDEDSSGDLSVTGWCLMALHTARMAGIDVPEDAFSRASHFLDLTADAGGVHYRYQPSDPESRYNPALTAVGLLGRQWLGWQKNDIAMQQGVRYLLDARYRPEWAPGKRNVYEWSYSAQVLHNVGGEEWKTWYGGLQTQIVQAQKRRGSRKAPNDVQGSWDPVSPRGADSEYAAQAGRLYLTTLSLLILETPYRHVPIYGAGQD